MNGITNNTMKLVSIAISGVGGQGVLTLAEVLAKAALDDGHNVRVGEIHGMAQRGGHVVCTVRIGPDAHGPIIDAGTADLLVGFEPAETLREITLIRKKGHILMNSHIIYPVAVSMGTTEYPSHEEIMKHMSAFCDNIIEFDAFDIAKKAGSTRSMNMVMMGGIIGSGITPISQNTALQAIRNAFPSKFEKINTDAFKSGLKTVKKYM